MSFLGRLSGFFAKHPLLKSSTQAGLLMGCGDLISQVVVERRRKFKEIDPIRTARFGLIGFGLIGPALFRWYIFLEKRIKFTNPAAMAGAKMIVDQFTFAPIFLIAFLVVNGALQGQGWSQISGAIRRDYPDILIANYKLWPAVQIINFSFIPLTHRVLFVQTVALFWNTYLAWKTNQNTKNSNEEDKIGLVLE